MNGPATMLISIGSPHTERMSSLISIGILTGVSAGVTAKSSWSSSVLSRREMRIESEIVIQADDHVSKELETDILNQIGAKFKSSKSDGIKV